MEQNCKIKNEIDEEDKDGPEEKLSPEEAKMMKALEEGKEIEDKTEKEAMHINQDKYEWFLKHLFDIHPKLGLIWKDYDLISKQKRVVFSLIKQMGANLLKGKSIMSVSLPITIMEPLSMLQRLAVVYTFLPPYAEKLVSSDPIEKMKNYMGFSIAALHVSLQQKKPFNPIWGETYQGYLGTEEFKVYCEQTSHHPPVANVLIDCPYFTLQAIHNMEAKTYPNSIRVKSKGKQIITFKDEKKTQYIVKQDPEVYITGMVMGKRIVVYENMMTIKDKTNKIYAQARFNPEKQGFFEKVFSKTVAERSDFFKGFITKSKALLKDTSRKAFYSKEIISYMEGHWCEELIIDGDYYWQLGVQKPVELISAKEHLESDSVNRIDLQALLKGNDEEAQKFKEELEDIQRRDRKLRADYEKSNKKSH